MNRSVSHHIWRISLRSAQMVGAAIVATGVFLREWWCSPARGTDALLQAIGRAVVRLCTTLGATFIKVGQIASTRADLLPRQLIQELATLRDQVPPFSFDAVRRTIEVDFGAPLETLFAEFDPEPVAAASVAQVHRAVLHTNGGSATSGSAASDRAAGDGRGERVAVKVRRPDIIEKVQLDRSILLFVARCMERLVPSLRLIALEGAIRNFCVAVEEQLHLTNEARNNERFTANFADDPDVLFPKLFPALCSDSVLTMAFIDGVREEDLEARGIDVRRVVEAGMRCVCRMIFLHGFVHADLHPGNMRFLPPGRAVLFDLGLVGSLIDEDRLTTAGLLLAFATGDGKTVAKILFDSAAHTATPDYAAYETEVCAMVDNLKSRGLGNMQITLEIGRIFDILRRHHIQADSHMTMVNLALMTAEGLGKRLAPDLSLADEALPYLAEALGVSVPLPTASVKQTPV